MARALATARRAATFDVPILLTGESGSGKHTLAAAIHRWSRRRAAPFVTIQWEVGRIGASIGKPAQYPRDAWQRTVFRLQAARRGTVFFEDVGALPAVVQLRLLGLLDQLPRERGIVEPTDADARVIAASDHDLEDDVRAGRFREDLFYRLSVLRIHVPALRERLEDLRELVARILEGLCVRYRRPPIELEPDVLQIFVRHRWPGNVRELVSVLERATALASGGILLEAHLPEYMLAARE
jgi:DNA-binding NtrC family response regulator